MKELWAITVALAHEAKPILSHLKVSSETHFKKMKLFEGRLGMKNCVVLQTGMGPEKAEKATRFLIEQYPITHLLSTGYCGALKPEIKNSEGILSNRIFFKQEGLRVLQGDDPMESWIQKKLSQAKLPFHQGPLLTVSEPVLDPVEKKNLGEETGALAIDMESFSVLKVAQENQKIASLVLRFVVDAQEDSLSDTQNFMDKEKGFQPWGLVQEMLRRPKILLQLPGLERMAHRARQNMEKAILALFRN